MNALVFDATIPADHILHLPDELPAGLAVRITVEPLAEDASADHYQPRTEIGRLALEARRAHLAAGGSLLNAAEISAEVHRRRGGAADE